MLHAGYSNQGIHFPVPLKPRERNLHSHGKNRLGWSQHETLGLAPVICLRATGSSEAGQQVGEGTLPLTDFIWPSVYGSLISYRCYHVESGKRSGCLPARARGTLFHLWGRSRSSCSARGRCFGAAWAIPSTSAALGT